jgi:sulfate permease, SulP family
MLTHLLKDSPPDAFEFNDLEGTSGPMRRAPSADDSLHLDVPDILVHSLSAMSETSPLLPAKNNRSSYGLQPAGSAVGDDEQHDIEHGQQKLPSSRFRFRRRIRSCLKGIDRRTIWENGVVDPIHRIPAVILGLLLNILDALSYGIILFPLGQPVFQDLGPDGICMFYVSCIISQLVYSLGGSAFKGGVGSEMVRIPRMKLTTD